MVSEWGLLADKEILVSSSLKGKKLARVISKVQVSDPGPSWPSCYGLLEFFYVAYVIFIFQLRIYFVAFLVSANIDICTCINILLKICLGSLFRSMI